MNKSQLKTKAKRIAKQATAAIKQELDYALKDHKLSKQELKHIGNKIKKEAKTEGKRIGVFLRQEFEREFNKAVPVIQAYLREGRKAVIKKKR
jgi:vacuolar-type H+-ATPase subunit E/Vma4